jgi:hypothetical protein
VGIYKTYQRTPWDRERARGLYEAGYCDQYIADVCDTSIDAVRSWRRTLGLKGHKRPIVEKDVKRSNTPTLAELAAKAKARGLSYGQYMLLRREGKV